MLMKNVMIIFIIVIICGLSFYVLIWDSNDQETEPNDDEQFPYEENQIFDWDNDGLTDNEDSDDDNDGIPDDEDQYPMDALHNTDEKFIVYFEFTVDAEKNNISLIEEKQSVSLSGPINITNERLFYYSTDILNEDDMNDIRKYEFVIDVWVIYTVEM